MTAATTKSNFSVRATIWFAHWISSQSVFDKVLTETGSFLKEQFICVMLPVQFLWMREKNQKATAEGSAGKQQCNDCL